MDVLVALGTTSAYLYGVVRIGVGYSVHDMHDMHMFKMMIEEHAHMFEISSTLIVIILLGKFLEALSKKKTVDKLSKLASLKVTKAILIEADENIPISLNTKEKEIDVDLLQLNDIVKVYPG